jgi:hypothetical protein
LDAVLWVTSEDGSEEDVEVYVEYTKEPLLIFPTRTLGKAQDQIKREQVSLFVLRHASEPDEVENGLRGSERLKEWSTVRWQREIWGLGSSRKRRLGEASPLVRTAVKLLGCI